MNERKPRTTAEAVRTMRTAAACSVQTETRWPGHSSASSPARFHKLFDDDPEAVLLTDPAGHVFAANPAACDLLRRSQREIRAAGRLGLVDTADPRFSAFDEQRTRIGQFVGEITMVRGDGTVFPGQVFASASFCDDGVAVKTTMVVRDLTEHKAAQTELEQYRRRFEDLVLERAGEMCEADALVVRELNERLRAEAETQATERRFQLLVERSSDLVLIVDDAGKVIYCSPSVERLTGYRQDEATGMVVDELIHSEDLAQIAALRRRRRTKSRAVPETGTLRIRHANGSLRWFEWSASSHFADEVIRGIVINARDVTERLLAEQTVRTSEERYRTLAETSPDMIYVVDGDGLIQYVNSRAAQRFGVPSEKLIGMPLAKMFEDATAAGTVAAVERVLASGEPYETDSMIAHPGGESWVSTRLVALKDNGRVSAVLGVSRDITERRLAQDALADSERHYRSLFEDSPVAMWEEDHSAVKAHLEQLVASGVEDVAAYLREHPAEYERCVALARTLDVNRAGVALFEASSREELLERVGELYPPSIATGLPSFWAAMLAGERSSSYEETNLTLAGRELRVLETRSVAPGHEDAFDRVYIADIDMTERRRAEDLLARYRLLATEARDIMLFVGAAGGAIMEANAAAEAAYGYSREELLRLTISDLRSASDGPAIDLQIAAAEAAGILFETEHHRKDGSLFPVEVSSRGTTMIDGVKVLLSVIRDITDRKRTENELTHATGRLERTLVAAVAALGATAELRDPYTAGHQRRVADLACAIAAELGWEEPRIESIRTAALLHDIGKIVVPAEILSKPGKLGETEILIIRQHAAAGADIVADIDFEGDIAQIIRQHHERLDGSGYPAGLQEKDILPEARVIAVADVVEAMLSHRPYRPALPPEAALAEIEDGSGTRYDAEACAACIRLIREQGFRLSG
jgi:PAS domain S-box-containing protein/putative nucleotidyltransferase with HDIG domain